MKCPQYPSDVSPFVGTWYSCHCVAVHWCLTLNPDAANDYYIKNKIRKHCFSMLRTWKCGYVCPVVQERTAQAGMWWSPGHRLSGWQSICLSPSEGLSALLLAMLPPKMMWPYRQSWLWCWNLCPWSRVNWPWLRFGGDWCWGSWHHVLVSVLLPSQHIGEPLSVCPHVMFLFLLEGMVFVSFHHCIWKDVSETFPLLP